MCLGLNYRLLIIMPTPPPCLLSLGLWYHSYPSILGGIFILVSTIIAMSVSSVFSMVPRFAFLLLIPFAFVYTFMFLSCTTTHSLTHSCHVFCSLFFVFYSFLFCVSLHGFWSGVGGGHFPTSAHMGLCLCSNVCVQVWCLGLGVLCGVCFFGCPLWPRFLSSFGLFY